MASPEKAKIGQLLNDGKSSSKISKLLAETWKGSWKNDLTKRKKYALRRGVKFIATHCKKILKMVLV